MKKIDVSIITINYNSSVYTLELIQSIEQTATDQYLYEIIVVDNASEQEDLSHLKKHLIGKENIKLVENKINSGFANGNMLGVNYASGKYLYFLNNDCKLLNDAIGIMKSFLDSHLQVSAVSGQMVDENQNLISSYKLFPTAAKQLFGNSFARRFSKHNFPSNKIKLSQESAVEVITGASMFFRSSDFAQIGGFDTALFLYCEEEDICKRVWDSGKKIYFLPKAKIFHKSGASSIQNSIDLEKEFYISLLHIFAKHNNLLVFFLLYVALLIKLFFRIFKRKNGLKIFLFALRGFAKKESLRYKQRLKR